MSNLKPAISIAAAAALLALSSTGPASAAAGAAASDRVRCYGINACKGQSDCKSAKNDCRGQNSCKAEGYKVITKAQCAKASGSLTPN